MKENLDKESERKSVMVRSSGKGVKQKGRSRVEKMYLNRKGGKKGNKMRTNRM